MVTLAQPEQKCSAFDTLNLQFNLQNEEFAKLISRLREKLNILSDTSNLEQIPSPKNEPKETPFNNGVMLTYWERLRANSMLINELCDQVNKLDTLL